MTNEFDVYCEKFRDYLAAGLLTTAAMSPLYKKALEVGHTPKSEDSPEYVYNAEEYDEPHHDIPNAIPVAKEIKPETPSVQTPSESEELPIDTIKYKLNRLKENKELLRLYVSKLPVEVLREIMHLNNKVPDNVLAPILYACVYKGFPHYDIVAGVLSRETAFGTDLDENMSGDHGHGRGIMQIDDRSHGAWLKLGLWKDPYENIAYGIGEIKDNLKIFQGNIFKSLAAYNCGAGNVKKALKKKDRSAEAFTAHHNYASDVLSRAKKYETPVQKVASTTP